MRYLTNALAGYEVHVALLLADRGALHRRGQPRAGERSTNYPRRRRTEDALIVLVNSYGKLQLPTAAAMTPSAS